MSEETNPVSDREIFASLRTELRRIARAKMRFERPDHTLQATALVNEAFIKLFKTDQPAEIWADSSQALRLIANAMEQILNDHADAHNAHKRGGAQRQRVPIDEQQARELGDDDQKVRIDTQLLVKSDQSEKVLGVRKVLELLRKSSPREARVLQLRFYCGLTLEEIAAVLGVSLETIKLDARKAKAFMKAHLAPQNEQILNE
jgi:RNA polymerase sigma-70 factor (ECF subfamily)